MQNSGYEMFALFMRYVFVFLMGLILLRSLWWLRKDAWQFRKELKQLPDAGLVGELVDQVNGKRYPLMRDGELGAARSNDVRIRFAGMPKRALRFLFVSGKGLQVTPVSRHRVYLDGEEVHGNGYALHGTQMEIGGMVLRVRLFAGLDVPRRVLYDEDGDKLDGQDEGPNPFEEAQGFVTEPDRNGQKDENPFADFAVDAPVQEYNPYSPAGQWMPPVQEHPFDQPMQGMYPPMQQGYPPAQENMWYQPGQEMYNQPVDNGYNAAWQEAPQQPMGMPEQPMPEPAENPWAQQREPIVRHRRSDRYR